MKFKFERVNDDMWVVVFAHCLSEAARKLESGDYVLVDVNGRPVSCPTNYR